MIISPQIEISLLQQKYARNLQKLWEYQLRGSVRTDSSSATIAPEVFASPSWSVAWEAICVSSQLFEHIWSDCSKTCTYPEHNLTGWCGCKRLLYGSCRIDGSMSGRILWRNAYEKCASNFWSFVELFLSCARCRKNRLVPLHLPIE